MKIRSVLSILCIIFLLLALSVADEFGSEGSETTEDETGIPIDIEDYIDEDGEIVLTEDVTGVIKELDIRESNFYDADGDGITGFTATNAQVENGFLTGGIFSASADASLLKIENSLFDIYFDMSEGDVVEITGTTNGGLELDYLLNILSEGVSSLIEYEDGASQEFTATEDNAIYAIYEDGVFEVTDGVLTFEDEEKMQTLDAGEDRSEVTVEETGIKKGILYKNKTYSQRSYASDLNITILNTENEEYTICTEEEDDCQAILANNVLYTEGEISVLQDGLKLYDAGSDNAVVTVDYNTKTMITNNLKPRSEVFLRSYLGHWKITETGEQLYFLPEAKEYTEVITSYVSELHNKTVSFSEAKLEYNTLKAFTPGSEGEMSCLEVKNEKKYC
tara:strand:- start:737 stop:1912 length:1176 start_codon:yes stop_codon:yes gene_type:complete